MVERTAGMLKSDQPMRSIEEETADAEEMMAEERQGFYKASEEL